MPETLTTPAHAGLFTASLTPVPLTGVSVVADIVGLCARVTVTQRYENREETPIEAVYLFPLDEGAAVCGFDALIDGTLVEGRAMEREEAFAMYDDAMQGGHGAYLLDEERPDVFQASIGNLPPGKTAIVKLAYVRELEVQNGMLQFVVPTTVAPRYAPAEDRIGVGQTDAEMLNPPREWTVPYGLDLTVTLSLGGAIARIESPSHPIAMSVADGKTIVTLGAAKTALDRDFVLAVSADGLDVPRAWLEREADGRMAIAVGFVPVLPTTPHASEVIFLVDESGSMRGESIAEVQNALQLCLRSMTPGCRFNVVGFGSDFDSLFTGSRLYDDKTLAAATEYVHRLSADRGGTEILPALKMVLGQPAVHGLRRQVVVMTDGEVTNTDEVVALVRAHASTTRVFTFGIGAGPSRHLVQGLARAGGGTAEFIAPGERIEAKVLRLFGRLLAPAIGDVAIDWGGLDVVQAPSVLPPLMHGMRLLAYALVKDTKPTGGAEGAPAQAAGATLKLTGTSADGPLRFDIAIDPSAAVEGNTVGTLAARARIRELEESPEWTSARRSQQGRVRGAGQMSREIVELALRKNLVSRETSIVAIERRDTPVTGDLQLRRVPIAMTSGWAGQTSRVPQQPGSAGGTILASRCEDIESLYDARLVVEASAPSRQAAPEFEALQPDLVVPELRRPGRGADDELRQRVLELASLQHADGSWPLGRPLADILRRSLRELEKAIPTSADEPALARAAWATALALAWLERHAAALEHEWWLLADKARRWLDAHVPDGDWRAAVRKLLG